MYLNNNVYNVLKWAAQVVLPGFATLYFAVAGIWGLPHTEQIVGTIVALNVFLGALLGLSTVQFKKAQAKAALMEGVPEAPLPTQPPFTLSTDTYDVLKWVALIFLPATGTLYFALSNLWGFPYGQQVVSTVVALTAFLGILLGVSTAQFKKAQPGGSG